MEAGFGHVAGKRVLVHADAHKSAEIRHGGAQDTLVPMHHFDVFIGPNGIVPMLERYIAARWDRFPDARVTMSAYLSPYTYISTHSVVVPSMSASSVLHVLNDAILYRLSCITIHEAPHLISQRYKELQSMLSHMQQAFGDIATENACTHMDAT